MKAIRDINGFVRTFVSEANGDVMAGQRKAAEVFGEAIANKEIDPRSVSVRQLFEATANFDGHMTVEDFASTEKVTESINSSMFPVMLKQITASIAMPAYERGLANVDQLVTDAGQAPNGVSPVTVTGFTDDFMPETVYEDMPYLEGKIEEKYAQVEMVVRGRILSLSKRALLADDSSKFIREAEMMGEQLGWDRQKFILQVLQDIAVTATGRAVNQNWWYEGTKGQVYNTAARTEEGSPTNNNDITTGLGGALSTAGLALAYTRGATFVDRMGENVNVNLRQLVVPKALVFTAEQLVNSSLQADSATNAVTPSSVKSLQIFASPVLDGTSGGGTRWFIGDFPRGIYWFWGWRPQVERETSTSTAAFERDQILRLKYSYYGGCGWVDYRYGIRSIP